MSKIKKNPKYERKQRIDEKHCLVENLRKENSLWPFGDSCFSLLVCLPEFFCSNTEKEKKEKVLYFKLFTFGNQCLRGKNQRPAQDSKKMV